MTSSSSAGMSIQFRILKFYSRPEEQLQERLRLKKSVISLSAAIGALGSPLGPCLEGDLATDLYSDSTLIANMDESNHRISFNLLNKSVISLLVMIGLSFRTLSRKRSSDRYTLWLYPDSYQR
jgi:hypothetical protein